MNLHDLSKFETSLVELLESLKTEQLRHVVVDDPAAPGVVPSLWRILLNPRQAFRRQFFAQIRYMRTRTTDPQFRTPMALAPLWDRTKTPRKLKPAVVSDNDLKFDRFNLAFRIRPCGSVYHQYYVAYPNSDFRFRTIAHEDSLRFFATHSELDTVIKPESLDFVPVRINSLGFDIKSRPRKREPCIPTIMEIFLPATGTNWDILNSDYGVPETLVDT